ncbi:hypothetical protein FRC14_007259 [Serendipita sp. 396]|nr:hypothetical protein FRC14_007259 [Serendipita sp. 396]KAG8786603.1 hypothetical protein FRC15_011079 [Serendipita sp. 397]KAG8801916.1 hypothetical protein FRC16_010807 [Serendipita sp. 398]
MSSISRTPHPEIISFQNISQYAAGSPSSCGLAALNAVRLLLDLTARKANVLQEIRKEDTIVEIMGICPFWESNEHLEAEEILSLPFFSCHLNMIRLENGICNYDNFRKLVRQLEPGQAALITKPPEIIALLNVSTEDDEDIFVAFDSHPRPEHPLGAAFVHFQSSQNAATYLSRLFRVEDGVLAQGGWQAQAMTEYSAHILEARLVSEIEETKAVYAANLKLLGSKTVMNSAMARHAAVQEEVARFKKLLEQRRKARQEASNAETEAEQKLQRLKADLKAARDFARSLPSTINSSGNAMQGMMQNAPMETNRNELRQLDQKGKGKGRVPDASGRREPTQRTYAQTTPSMVDDEAAEYERARLESIAEKAKKRAPQQRSPPASSHTDDRAMALRIQAQEREDFERARQLQMEEERAVMHLQQLRAAHPTFECGICMDDQSMEDVAKNDACGHNICRQCMCRHVISELDRSVWPIICPMCKADPQRDGEPGVINRRTVELAGADEATLEKWTRVELAVVSVMVECPKCHKVAPVDSIDFEATEMLWCQYDCGAYWCKKCNQMAERGMVHSCDGEAEFERWRDQQGDVRHCPGCNTAIQRNEGCRHMTCVKPGCNTHFCDRCGQMMCQSQKKTEIDEAVRRHFSGGCELFDYAPSDDDQPQVRRR